MPFRRKGTRNYYMDFRPRIAGKPTGERIRLLMPHVHSMPEAREEEQRIIREMRGGKSVHSVTLGDFAKNYYLPWADQLKAPENYHTRVKALTDFFGESMLLADFSPFSFEKFKIERAKTKTLRGNLRSPGTINNELSAASKIFSMAIGEGLIQKHPMDTVSPLEEDSWRTRSLSIEEEVRLMNFLDSPEYLKPIVRLALLTGMRQGEILGLEWEHVRLDRSLLYVMKPKWSKDPRRTEGLPLSDAACEIIDSQARGQYVFPNKMGNRIFSTNLIHGFVREREKAEIEDFHFHDLRHTFGSRMAASGCPLHKLQRLMGHQDPKMTMRYIHVGEGELREALRLGTPYLQGIGLSTATTKLRSVG